MGVRSFKQERNFPGEKPEQNTRNVKVGLQGNLRAAVPGVKLKSAKMKRPVVSAKDDVIVQKNPAYLRPEEKEDRIRLLETRLKNVETSLIFAKNRIVCLEKQVKEESRKNENPFLLKKEEGKSGKKFTGSKLREIENIFRGLNEKSEELIPDRKSQPVMTNRRLVVKGNIEPKGLDMALAADANVAQKRKVEAYQKQLKPVPLGSEKREEVQATSTSEEESKKAKKDRIPGIDIQSPSKNSNLLQQKANNEVDNPRPKTAKRQAEKKPTTSKPAKFQRKKERRLSDPQMGRNSVSNCSSKNPQTIKFERKRKGVVKYTKEQLVAFARGESVFETTKYKLVKLVEVKRMSGDRIDQFCSKILGITRYHRGYPAYSNELNAYIMLVNENILMGKSLETKKNLAGISLFEVGKNYIFLQNYCKKVMENEKSGNKPLFIAASILFKAITKRNMSSTKHILAEESLGPQTKSDENQNTTPPCITEELKEPTHKIEGDLF